MIGNCGFDEKNSFSAVDNGDTDAIAYAKLYLSTPDLVKRLKTGTIKFP